MEEAKEFDGSPKILLMLCLPIEDR